MSENDETRESADSTDEEPDSPGSNPGGSTGKIRLQVRGIEGGDDHAE
ncbi:hypothetical protein [Natrialbaceae archaeon AArc-T1-2]|nr:hypothetical protein [Natrialbaceae archaeon AArc-T1-2]WIV66565.1 hypothetical protein QQ977_12810 [Natrialbaceae archaeon AArc-T1-2]